MSPGQYGNHVASAGYDPTADPLIERKTDELRVLDHYARWQKKYMRRVTARKLKEQRPIDEQAIEAALTDRWKLMTKPLKKLGKQPEWRIVGFLLDDESEVFLAKESRQSEQDGAADGWVGGSDESDSDSAETLSLGRGTRSPKRWHQTNAVQ